MMCLQLLSYVNASSNTEKYWRLHSADLKSKHVCQFLIYTESHNMYKTYSCSGSASIYGKRIRKKDSSKRDAWVCFFRTHRRSLTLPAFTFASNPTPYYIKRVEFTFKIYWIYCKHFALKDIYCCISLQKKKRHFINHTENVPM